MNLERGNVNTVKWKVSRDGSPEHHQVTIYPYSHTV